MSFTLKNITIQCIQAGADVGAAFGDDLYLRVDGNKFPIFNLSTSGFADQGFGFRPGQLGSALTGAGATVGDHPVISLFDKDGTDVDGLTGLFEGGDDFIGSTLLAPQASRAFTGTQHFFFTISGEGSVYNVQANIDQNFSLSGGTGGLLTKRPVAAVGKVASQAGGVMNGLNIAGTLVGRNGKDIINANGGDDTVLGGNNSDILNGGKGKDIVFGGKGKDIVTGGADADIFVIAPKTGLDTGTDFRDGEDLIGLGSNLVFQDLSFIQQTKGTLIKANSEKLIFLQGVSANQLTAEDFTQVNISGLNKSANLLVGWAAQGD